MAQPTLAQGGQVLIYHLKDVEEATLARQQCATLLQQGAGTGQLWYSCLARLLLGEVTCTCVSCMPGTPVPVFSHLC